MFSKFPLNFPDDRLKGLIVVAKSCACKIVLQSSQKIIEKTQAKLRFCKIMQKNPAVKV